MGKVVIMMQTLPLMSQEKQIELEKEFGEFIIKETDKVKYLIQKND